MRRRYWPRSWRARSAARATVSPRELEVRGLMIEGKRYPEIAIGLAVTEGTVTLAVSNVLSKLGATDWTEAVTQALQRGIAALAP